MNSTQQLLIKCLADGCFHSGEELGREAGVSRAAVWKHLQQLDALGIDVTRQKGRGYVVVGGLSLLDADRMQSLLTAEAAALLSALDILLQTESTNQYLLDQVASSGAHAQVCFAERQTRGRGRRGRHWVSPFAANIYMSMSWRFTQGVAALEGLSLAIGVAVCDALQAMGFEHLQLKWPNDILLGGRKLAGILIELAGDVSGECYVVVGLGLNVNMPNSMAMQIDQPWTDLASISTGLPDRNRIAAMLLNGLIPLLSRYEQDGFGRYRGAWESRNAYQGQRVNLITPATTVSGVMLGVSGSGGLRLQVDGLEQVYLGGEVSLRIA